MSSFQQSVSKWCFPQIPLPDFARDVAGMGLASIELLDPADWPVPREHGLICALSNAPAPATLEAGINHLDTHAALLPAYRKRILECAAAGVPNLICFSGNRRGLSDEAGLENCAVFLRQITGDAERAGVTLCMELLNSKVDHPDYQCDHTAWGVELCRRVGSERLKLLYDIYHMQIMEGDVVRAIETFHPYIAHYHTAGNPGRHEIDDSQELNYRAVMRAIHATGFDGFVGHEFIPKGDPMQSLREAVAICDVQDP